MTSSPIGFLKVKLELLQRHPSMIYFEHSESCLHLEGIEAVGYCYQPLNLFTLDVQETVLSDRQIIWGE
jgi:hypothetical protein